MIGSFIKKYFSSHIAKIKFVDKLDSAKNVIYFSPETEFSSNEPKDPLIKLLKNSHTKAITDINKTKSGIIYPWQNSFFSERLCLVNTPLKELNKLRSTASKAFKSLTSYEAEDVSVVFSNSMPLHHRRLVLQSLIMSNYSFKHSGSVKEEADKENNSKTKDPEKNKSKVINKFHILRDPITDNNMKSLSFWINMANATLFTRNLANERPNVADCDFLEDQARKIYDDNRDRGVKIEVIKGDALLENNLNLFHAVGRAAQTPPRLVILSYKGDPNKEGFSHAVVGKGLTFDTGGLNLKPTGYIEDMYLDKHGACNSLSIFKTVVEAGMKINLVCALGIAENSIDGTSYKPSDIIKSHKGYTVEITNTDAEGRLVLADTLSYLQEKYNPKNIVDLATLTGACVVALGNKTAGLFTNSNAFASNLFTASEEVLEPIWHMPIFDEHRTAMKSRFADLQNAEKGRYGGASKAAAFLEKFINKSTNWVHLDIAG